MAADGVLSPCYLIKLVPRSQRKQKRQVLRDVNPFVCQRVIPVDKEFAYSYFNVVGGLLVGQEIENATQP